MCCFHRSCWKHLQFKRKKLFARKERSDLYIPVMRKAFRIWLWSLKSPLSEVFSTIGWKNRLVLDPVGSFVLARGLRHQGMFGPKLLWFYLDLRSWKLENSFCVWSSLYPKMCVLFPENHTWGPNCNQKAQSYI